ncbi:MAG TPA: Rrf2 family transcriptional regulator [Azospirillum sp.]
MQITRFTDYAIRVLTYCAVRGGELATTQEIAERYGISTNHLVKVVQELSRHGYLEAVRGKGGGIRLARPPEQIDLGELIGRLEEMDLAECFATGNACRITPACRMTAILAEARAAFLAALSRHTLADVVRPQGELRALLSIAAP